MDRLFFEGIGLFSLGKKRFLVESSSKVEVDKVLAALTEPKIKETRVVYTFPYYYILDGEGNIIAYRTSPYTIKELKEYDN